MVSLPIQEDRCARGIRSVLRAAGQPQLPSGSKRPFNTVYAVKTIAFSSIAPGATYTGAKVIPSGVQPNLQTPTVEVLEPENRSGTFAEHLARRQLHRFSWLPRIALLGRESAYADDLPGSRPAPHAILAGAYYYPPGAALANNAVWNTTHWFSEGISSFNGIEVDVNHRWKSGLQFRGVYAFSKALDDGDNMNTSVATNSPAFVANPFLPKADYGRASFDVRHSAVINATYDLPFGRGRLANEHPWVQQLIANWQLSAIETAQTGLPFHSTVVLQPIERWRHSESSPSILESEFYRSRDSGRTRPLLQSQCLHSTSARNLRQRRPQSSGRPGTRRNRSVSREKLSTFRTFEFAVPLRILQHPESHKLQRAESRRLRVRHGRTFADGRSDHIHVNDLSPDSNWLQVTLVKATLLKMEQRPRRENGPR